MDWLRGIAIILSLDVLFLFGAAVYYLWEKMNKHREQKDRALIERRRREFAEDIEMCGQRMRNADRICEILHKGKQTIKYTGIFSGEEIERTMSNEIL